MLNMRDHGFEIWDTGGNCTAWGKACPNGGEVRICADSSHDGDPDLAEWIVERRNTENGFYSVEDVTLRVALNIARRIPAPVGDEQRILWPHEIEDFMRIPSGAEVSLVDVWDLYPVGIFPADTAGTAQEDGVKLSFLHDSLREWDNCLMISDMHGWEYWQPCELIRNAFPDYPMESLPTVPARFVDSSWRNDTCPSFDLGRGLQVYCDYPNHGDREVPGGNRYTVVQWADSGESELVLYTDSWEDVVYTADYDRPTWHASHWPGTTESARSMAEEYVKVLYEWLDQDQWRAWVKGANEHDLIDANDAILEACERRKVTLWRDGTEAQRLRLDGMYDEAMAFLNEFVRVAHSMRTRTWQGVLI